MTDPSRSDPKGHTLLRERIESAEEELLGLAENPLAASARPTARWIVGGVGSSEAHARYFSAIVNRYSPSTAAYVHLSESASGQRRGDGIGWLYFSQGFSHNAVAATRHWTQATDTLRVLVTAADPEQLERSGETSRAAQLRKLLESGVQLVSMPGQSEYTILIRVVGPLCGFLAALRLARCAGAGGITDPDGTIIREIRNAAQSAWETDANNLCDEWLEEAGLNTLGPIGDCIQNLMLKRLEGIYRDPSPARDLLSYAHGYFQRETLTARPQWVLCDKEYPGHPIVQGFLSMNVGKGIPVRLLVSPVAFPLNVFFYEMLWNRLLLKAVTSLGIDQKQWPGQGADGPLYKWNAGL